VKFPGRRVGRALEPQQGTNSNIEGIHGLKTDSSKKTSDVVKTLLANMASVKRHDTSLHLQVIPTTGRVCLKHGVPSPQFVEMIRF